MLRFWLQKRQKIWANIIFFLLGYTWFSNIVNDSASLHRLIIFIINLYLLLVNVRYFEKAAKFETVLPIFGRLISSLKKFEKFCGLLWIPEVYMSVYFNYFSVCPTILIIGRTSWLSLSLTEIKKLTRFSAGEWSVKQNLVNVKNLERMVSSSQLTTNRTSSMSSQLWVWIFCCTGFSYHLCYKIIFWMLFQFLYIALWMFWKITLAKS